jgi:hypothetical protein
LLTAIIVGLKDLVAQVSSPLTMLGIILGVASPRRHRQRNGEWAKEAMIAMGGADKVLLDEQDVPAYQEHLAEEAPGRTMVDFGAAAKRSADSPGLARNGFEERDNYASRKNGQPIRVRRCLDRSVGNESAHVAVRALFQ